LKTVFIEATSPQGNHGKFMLARWEGEEWARRSPIHDHLQLLACGHDPQHLLVLDLETCEGAVMRPGGYAHADLEKHAIWVCPLFEPFLEWLWKQDCSDLDKLPKHVEVSAPLQFAGYRRPGPKE
jgi:hypothetical protein